MKNSDGKREGGTLYVVSTPVGNLEDITLRALKILGEVDLVAAESVDHTRVLCERYGIRAKLTSYNQHNRKTKAPRLLTRLRSGQDVALVTNAGTPGISDPGVFVIGQALREGIRVSPVPGPSAVTAALSAAGLRAERFIFLGFLSPKQGKRRKELKALAAQPHTMVFFEAPHRLAATLEDMREILGDRSMVLLKEMTKVFESVTGGSILTVLDRLGKEEEIRGEYTIVVAGSEKRKERKEINDEIEAAIDHMLKSGKKSVRDIAREISSETGADYRSVYKACIRRKKQEDVIS
jgi:16S rRNA (cytidine1402-2'-O)-methyltransferase